MKIATSLLLGLGLLSAVAMARAEHSDTQPYFPDAQYPEGTPDAEDCLGFPLGQRAATPAEIGACLEAWAAASDRMRVTRYASTHEGRPLYYVVLGTPERLGKLDEVRAGWDRLADPSGLDDHRARQLLDELPAVAWLAYSIHGDETSGADAALAVIHHLAFDRGEDTNRLLDKLLVIVDPMMNPDGRHRFLQQVAEFRGEKHNLDDQSLVHTGYWPWGRTNHYLFDMNRDWLFGTQPETRGRMKAVEMWHPQMFVDAHEMGPQESYLFSPPRQPYNPNLPDWQHQWNRQFARDQASAFDAHGWRYYTGEWNDDWYPGYSDAWAALGGAIGILYEQAGVADDGVKQAGGYVLSYREAVFHHLTSSMANLRSLAANAKAIKQDWYEQRREAVSGGGPYAKRTFAVLPTKNQGRLKDFVDLMNLQGVRVYRLDRDTSLGDATDQLGRRRGRVDLPAGTLLIPNRQPLAQRTAALLEFDPHIPEDSLHNERKRLLREGQTTVYDVTAWNLTMLFGLESLTLESALPGAVTRIESLPSTAPHQESKAEPVGWYFDGADDRAQAAAAWLLQHDVRVRLARRDTELGGKSVAAGSPLVLAVDNRQLALDLPGRLAAAADASGIAARAVETGLGEGDRADLGGEYFPILPRPRVALVTRGDIDSYDFGADWYYLDQKLGLRNSHLDVDRLADTDLRRYNVIVLPNRSRGQLPEDALAALRSWVHDGGSLIAVGGSARQLATTDADMGNTRLLPDVLDDPLPYRVALAREWQAARDDMPAASSIWAHDAPLSLDVPWEMEHPDESAGGGGEKSKSEASGGMPEPTAAQLEDDWQALFMPQGALLATRTDHKSWLMLGAGDYLPVMTGDAPVLMAARSVSAPARFGVLLPSDDDAVSGPHDLGWAPMPAGDELRLRMSGLLWPEAAHRLANAAWLTRESVGSGQLILFATPPVFRGASLATARVFANAVLYGPGLGASAPIEP